jgi:hypothetical protein
VLREQLAHPLCAKMTRDWFTLQGANEYGYMLCMFTSKLDETQMPTMGGHELT